MYVMPGRVRGGFEAVAAPSCDTGSSGAGLSRYQNQTGDGSTERKLCTPIGTKLG